ncbi:hypothetical protein [Streptosporangium album]|uniref:hypothetical protein n=1 Tax=Streptosporangium album TaxID=47479 RepID=UPI0031E8D8D1
MPGIPPTAVCASSRARACPYDSRASPVPGQMPRGQGDAAHERAGGLRGDPAAREGTAVFHDLLRVALDGAWPVTNPE